MLLKYENCTIIEIPVYSVHMGQLFSTCSPSPQLSFWKGSHFIRKAEYGHLGLPIILWRHVKSISANISAWKALRRSIRVSKYTFSESRNALESLKIALDDYLFRDQINILILAMNSHNFQHRS